MTGRTLYDKIFDEHAIHTEEDGTTILYIDRHLVHEVTSPQAFEGLRMAGRKLWRVSSVVATADHNTPTPGWERGYDGIEDPISKEQITTLNDNIGEFGAAAFFPFKMCIRDRSTPMACAAMCAFMPISRPSCSFCPRTWAALRASTARSRLTCRST